MITPGGPQLPEGYVEVARVLDGGTFEILRDEEIIRVRLAGVQAPELHPFVECGGEEAAAWLTARLPEGSMVRLELGDIPFDDIGREVAVVWDGARLVNSEMAFAGWALASSSGESPEVADRISTSELMARQDHRGLFNPELGCFVD